MKEHLNNCSFATKTGFTGSLFYTPSLASWQKKYCRISSFRFGKKRLELPSIHNFSSWLFILTRNRCFNVLRDLARFNSNKQSLLDELPDAKVETADTRLLSSEAEKLLEEAMDRLTPAQRQAFELFKLKGLSREETATKMGISPNTVKVHLLNAMRIIRTFFIEKDLLIPAVTAGLIIIS